MKDVAGKTLNVGDKVALARTGYRDLVVGEIIKFTPKGMKVKFKHTPLQDHFSETYRAERMVSLVQPKETV